MRSCPAKCVGFLISLPLVLMLAACGGGGSNTAKPPETPAKVTLSGPGSATVVSLVPGQTVQLTPLALNAQGGTLSGETFTYQAKNTTSTDTATPFVSVSNGGLACAGTWDSLSNPVVCSPSTRIDSSLPANLQAPGVGQALVTATALSVVSDPVTFYVHRPVDNISVTCIDSSGNAQVCPTASNLNACLSQTQTQKYKAIAVARNELGQDVDVTDTIGTFTWVAQGAAGKVTDTSSGTTTTITAQNPGLAQIFASSNNVQSTSQPFVTCPVKQIKLHVASGTETSATIDKAAVTSLATDVTDIKGNPVTGLALTFSSTQPLVAGASASITGASAGTTTISASCTPPACNTGLPGTGVYSNAFVVNVNGTTATTTVYVASTQGTSVVPVPSDTNTPGTAISLGTGNNPNSMLFNHRGSALYIGTNNGLIVLSPATNAVTTPNASLPGKVLAVSPDDNTLLISDTVNNKVYAVSPNASTNQIRTLDIAGATAASFSPDSVTAYVVGNGFWSSFSSTTTPLPQNVGGATNDVDFLTTGAFGYIAGSGSGVAVRATCNDSAKPNVVTSGVPTSIHGLPDGNRLLAVVSPNIDVITASTDNIGCPPEIANTASATAINATTFGPPTGFAVPQLILTSDGTRAFVTSNQAGKLLGYDVVNARSAPLQLVGGVTETFTGAATLDGKLLYVGAGGTNTLHKIDLTTNQDVNQIPITFVPDLVAVLPK